MSRLRALVLVGLFLGHQAAGSSLAAQATPATDLAPGTRVRVRFDCTTKAPSLVRPPPSEAPKESCRTATGTVTSLSAKSLVFNTGSAEQSVTPVTLRELGVHDGRGRRTLSGLVVGVVVGAALGVVSYSYANGGGCASTDTDSNFCFAAGAVGAAGGALLGAGIGSLIRTDRWRPVPSPWSAARTDRPALGLLLTPPLRSRPGVVGVAIGF